MTSYEELGVKERLQRDIRVITGEIGYEKWRVRETGSEGVLTGGLDYIRNVSNI